MPRGNNASRTLCAHTQPGNKRHDRRRIIQQAIVERMEERRLLSAYLPAPALTLGATAGDQAGTAMDAQGGYVLIGAPAATVDSMAKAGEAYLVNAASGAVVAVFQNPVAVENEAFGLTVALVGEYVVIGAPNSNSAMGAVYVFTQDDHDAWYLADTLEGGKYSSTPSAFFGSEIEAFDSTHVLISATQGSTTGQGAVFLFDLAAQHEPGTASYDAVIESPGTSLYPDEFGGSLAVKGSQILIGARQYTATPVEPIDPENPNMAIATGAAFLYTYEAGLVSAPTMLSVPGSGFELFGTSVAFAGGSIVVGAPGDVGGKVYVMNAAGIVLQTISNPSPALGENFGQALSLSGGTLVVGAPQALAPCVVGYDENGQPVTADLPAGAVYVYQLDLTVTDPQPLQELVNPTLPTNYADPDYTAASDAFGFAVALSGERLFVGDFGDDTAGIDSGGVYIYQLEGTSPPLTVTAPTTPAIAVRGFDTLVSASFTAAPGATYNILWDFGDGSTLPATAETPGPISASHVYADNGSYRVTVTVTDANGRSDIATSAQPIAVQSAGVVGGELWIGGNASSVNAITLTPAFGGAISVFANGDAGTFPLANDAVIVIRGGNAGNVIAVAGGVTRPTLIFGGAGIDLIKGGNGSSVIVGGGGADLIVGGNGRDVLIGGAGTDRIVGSAADDILIAGTTAYDADPVALKAILAEWTSGRTYAQRIENLRNASGYALGGDAAETVFDDGSIDLLTGSAGSDWFLFNRDSGVRDFVTDLSAREFADDIDFITQG